MRLLEFKDSYISKAIHESSNNEVLHLVGNIKEKSLQKTLINGGLVSGIIITEDKSRITILGKKFTSRDS